MLTLNMITSAMTRVVEYLKKTYNVEVYYNLESGMSMGIPSFLKLNWVDNNRKYQQMISLDSIPTVGPPDRQTTHLAEVIAREVEQKIKDWRYSTQQSKNETAIEKSRHEAITQYYEDRVRSDKYHTRPITEDECYKKPRKTLLLC